MSVAALNNTAMHSLALRSMMIDIAGRCTSMHLESGADESSDSHHDLLVLMSR